LTTCIGAGKMLTFLEGKASDRKVRLFVSACCRAVVEGMGESIRHPLRLVEPVAEGQVPLEEFLRGYKSPQKARCFSGTRRRCSARRSRD
jgi:hypothetical protein